MPKRSSSAKGQIRGAQRSKHKVKSSRSDARTEERLRRSEMLLAQAEQLANIGSWELDVESNTLAWSAHFYRMLGHKPKRAAVPHAWGIRFIHPDDRERAECDLNAILSTGAPLDNELRFTTADGSVRVFHSRAVAITDKRGKVVRVRGMSQDVTESRAAETTMRKSESLLSHAEEIAHLGSWEYDVQPAVARLSKNLRAMYGLAENEEFTRE
ncbi:MAG TPA: PAS domain-containing protein, partial [Candidatus Acidoferrales bacterium]|nr:PAS domain-containing protein [Candidatus Acidoferrales bacterium]